MVGAVQLWYQVSIHAPRAGSDLTNLSFLHLWHTCFNPRPPCGERLPGLTVSQRWLRFNPRPPCGERLI